MSVLNVCTTDIDRELINRRYRNNNHPHHSATIGPDPAMSSSLFYRRFSMNNQHSNTTTVDSYDNYSSYTSSSRNSSFEVIFSRLLDVLIFTSAIAITAYSYLTGTLVQPFVEGPKPTVLVGYTTPSPKRNSLQSNSSSSHHYHHHHHSNNSNKKNVIEYDPIEDAKRKRTQEWAEQQIIPQQPIMLVQPNSPIPTQKKRSCSTTLLVDKKVQPLSRDNNNHNMKREKKRTQSLPVNQPPLKNDEKEDELISRLQSLIQQGQDALSSPVEYNNNL